LISAAERGSAEALWEKIYSKWERRSVSSCTRLFSRALWLRQPRSTAQTMSGATVLDDLLF
jgi:hypothetical protein